MSTEAPEKATTRFNVVHVIADQHNYRCLGTAKQFEVHTPNIDALARDGVVFSKAYTNNPICTPSRMSILSGQYCHNHGYYGLSGPTPANTIPTYLGHFRRNGYRTAAIGKIHLPDDPVNWLVHQNDVDIFEDCYFSVNGIPYTNNPYVHYLKGCGLLAEEDSRTFPELAPARCSHDDARPSNLPYEHSVEAWCVREAIDFIDGSGDTPFCVQLSLPRPHACYTPSREFWDLYPDEIELPPQFFVENPDRPPFFGSAVAANRENVGLFEPKGFMEMSKRRWKGYLASVSQVDHALGEIVDHLQRRGLRERTIVVYNTDHGAYTGLYGIAEKAPGICSEEVCRIPFIWNGPRIIPGGTHRELVENVDLAPTIAALCGLPAMDTADGSDLSTVLAGGGPPDGRVAVTENPWSRAIRFDRWRLVHYQPQMFDGSDVGELYDVENDPDEQRNLYLSNEYRDVIEHGRRLLLEWLIRTTRNVTTWPPISRNPDLTSNYRHGADGKEASGFGPAIRRDKGQLNYL